MNEAAMQARISALMDGEMYSDDPAPGAACHDVAWSAVAADAEARQTWLQYHQIGDLLRSSELAPLQLEQAFLRRFSERLCQEPVQLAPVAQVATQQPKRLRARWAATGAALAGVAAVALVSFSSLPPIHQPVQLVAQRPVESSALVTPPLHIARDVQSDQIPVVDKMGGQMPAIWAQYLMAHQQLAGSVLPYTPAGIHEADFRVALAH
ncbi:MAG: sigma-E factor negative regulatory protein [Burkholderiales bacterium]|nr:sigma-E factor negative regulatory protein [Burkholderiales bacterium]